MWFLAVGLVFRKSPIGMLLSVMYFFFFEDSFYLYLIARLQTKWESHFMKEKVLLFRA